MFKAACILFFAVAFLPIYAAAQGAEDLVKDKLLRFGMLQEQALEMVDGNDDWQVAYRISTPSTLDLACRYKEVMFFQARFLNGRCYYIESRFEAEVADIEQVFEHYRGKLGDSPEATQSRDAKLMFARWNTDNLDLSLTAYRRDSGLYVLTYEEFEPETIGVARYTQEKEMESLPMEIDPITGQPRPVHNPPQAAPGQKGGENPAESDKEDDKAGDEKKKKKRKLPPPKEDEWDEP